MDSSFHYCMTYAAAREAGFSSYNAGQVALYAECVDESMGLNLIHKYSYKFTNLRRTRNTSPYEKDVGLQMTQHWTDDTRMRDLAGRGKSAGRSPEMMILMAFHFLPGLQSPSEVNTGIPIIDNTVLQYALSSEHRAVTLIAERENYRQGGGRKNLAAYNRKISRVGARMAAKTRGQKTKTDWKEMLITWPSSLSSKLMMQDTQEKVNAECRNNMKGDVINRLNLNRGINLRNPRMRPLGNIVKEKHINISVKDFLLALVGVRMHIYADTFAHQGFSGARSARINNAINRQYRRICSIPDYTKVPDGIGAATRTKFYPKSIGKYWLMTPSGISHVGHGALGALPDYPNCIYKYTRPRDSKIIRRDNPPIYYQAYLHMKEELKKMPDELKTDMMLGARPNVTVSDNLVTENFFVNNVEKWPDEVRGREWMNYISRWDPDAKLALTEIIVDGDHKAHHALHRLSLPQRHVFSLVSSYHLYWLHVLINTVTKKSPQDFLRRALTKTAHI